MLWPGVYKDLDLVIKAIDNSEIYDELLIEGPPWLVEAYLYKDSDGDNYYESGTDTELVKDLYGKPISIQFYLQ